MARRLVASALGGGFLLSLGVGAAFLVGLVDIRYDYFEPDLWRMSRGWRRLLGLLGKQLNGPLELKIGLGLHSLGNDNIGLHSPALNAPSRGRVPPGH